MRQTRLMCLFLWQATEQRHLLPPLIKKVEAIETFTSDADSINVSTVILVDKDTSGPAELFACDMRDFGKAKLVGTATKGNGTMQRVYQLSDGGAVKLTVAEIKPYTSDVYNGVGLTPDYLVELSSQKRTVWHFYLIQRMNSIKRQILS